LSRGLLSLLFKSINYTILSGDALDERHTLCAIIYKSRGRIPPALTEELVGV
jgi:hypothetical protein